MRWFSIQLRMCESVTFFKSALLGNMGIYTGQVGWTWHLGTRIIARVNGLEKQNWRSSFIRDYIRIWCKSHHSWVWKLRSNNTTVMLNITIIKLAILQNRVGSVWDDCLIGIWTYSHPSAIRVRYGEERRTSSSKLFPLLALSFTTWKSRFKNI